MALCFQHEPSPLVLWFPLGLISCPVLTCFTCVLFRVVSSPLCVSPPTPHPHPSPPHVLSPVSHLLWTDVNCVFMYIWCSHVGLSVFARPFVEFNFDTGPFVASATWVLYDPDYLPARHNRSRIEWNKSSELFQKHFHFRLSNVTERSWSEQIKTAISGKIFLLHWLWRLLAFHGCPCSARTETQRLSTCVLWTICPGMQYG